MKICTPSNQKCESQNGALEGIGGNRDPFSSIFPACKAGKRGLLQGSNGPGPSGTESCSGHEGSHSSPRTAAFDSRSSKVSGQQHHRPCAASTASARISSVNRALSTENSGLVL